MAFAKAHGKLSELFSFKEPDISHTNVFKLIKPPHPLTASIPLQYGCENVEKRKPKKRLAKIELLFRICLSSSFRIRNRDFNISCGMDVSVPSRITHYVQSRNALKCLLVDG